MTETIESTPAGPEATAGAPKKRGGGLNSMLIADLKSMAAGMGIPGASTMKKAQLIEAIKGAQSGAGARTDSAPSKDSAPRKDSGRRSEAPAEQAASRGSEAPAEEGRGDVLGGPLEVGSESQHRVVVHQQPSARDQGPGQNDAGDDRGRGGAEAAAVRDDVRAGQAEAGRLGVHHRERRPHRPHHQVRLVARDVTGALAGDLDAEPLGDDLGLELVAQVDREAERVEAGAQVGRRGRHRDADRTVDEPGHQVSPAAAAAASTSASTMLSTRCPKPSRAVAVSFRP